MGDGKFMITGSSWWKAKPIGTNPIGKPYELIRFWVLRAPNPMN